MGALAQGQTSDCTNPVLDVFMSVNGILTDVDTLEFQIWEKVTTPTVPIQVYPVTPGDRQAVDTTTLCPTGGKLSTGRFVADWTVPVGEPIGTHEIRWFFKLTPTSPESTFKEEFEVLSEVAAAASDTYCSVASMRAEGIDATIIGDADLQIVLARASDFIDQVTGRHFSPESKVINVDGSGARALLFDEPIIAINTISIEATVTNPSLTPVDSELFKVYNRHLTQKLRRPDDRNNPKVEYAYPADYNASTTTLFQSLIWPEGQQNIVVDGVFGYTDYDGSPTGVTPSLICRVCQLLAFRDIYKLVELDKREDVQKRWKLLSERTRDQSYTFMTAASGRSAIMGSITGDPTIDTLLVMFMRPPMFGSA